MTILKQHSPLEFADLDLRHLVQVQERAYYLEDGSHSYFIKWIPREDERGINEIQSNREILSGADVPAPRLLLELNTEGAILACWEWLEGGDLREKNRNRLPEAFARLGHFHLAHRYAGPVCSPVTHYAFASIPEMLRAEATFLCSFYKPSVEAQCIEIFARLETGYPTFIHGDMHPGNIYCSPGGLKFIDWGYAIRSLNLFDLDYVQSIRLSSEEQTWWIITPDEARNILPAYFAACGLGLMDYQAIHHAVMLWSELLSHYNCIQNHLQAETVGRRQNIDLLLDRHLSEYTVK